jgi:LPXTG-site transpeptidase (sortase) family protein
VVSLQIPALKVKRAVVPIGMRPDNTGAMSWDTDAIFATNNRPDLVGHLVGSAYPGQGGNVILIGHNYNQVDYGWEGVFVDIKTLQLGDRIIIHGEDGREYTYIVQQVKQVPWRSQNAKELEKHLKFLGPVKSERLTLVTCGGANIWPFPARVYVVAVPENP